MSSAGWRRWSRPVALAAAALLVALCAATDAPQAARAQDGDDPAEAGDGPEVGLRLSDLTGVLAPEGDDEGDDEGGGETGADPGAAGSAAAAPDAGVAAQGSALSSELSLRVLVDNHGDAAVDDLSTVVEVHPAAGSRHELAQVLDEGADAPQGPVHQQEVRGLQPVGPGEVAGVSVSLGADELPLAESGGVHPVRVTLLRGAEVLDEVTTAVVWLGDTRGSPLRTTLVWPLAGAPWRTEQGAYRSGAQRAIRPGGRLDVLLSGVERHPDAGVLLSPAAHLLEDLRDQASGFTRVERQPDGTFSSQSVAPEDAAAERADATLRRVREAAEELTHQPVAGAYANANLHGLISHSEALRDVAGELASLGRVRLQETLEHTVDASSFLVDAPPGPEALDLVPAQHLLVAPGAVAQAPSSEGIHGLRSPSGRPLTASVGDPTITELLSEPDRGGLVGAQRVLAESAMVYFETPGEDDRALSMHPPPDWDPQPELVHALLDDVASAPWLELVSPAQQQASGTATDGELELATPEEEAFPGELGRDLETAMTDLEAARRAWPEEVEEGPERSRAALRTALFRATSTWTAGNAEAQTLVRDVRAELDGFFGDVEVASGSQVTLTADTGQVPVTIRRTRGGPITLGVEVASQGRLVWDERRSEDIVLDEGEAHTVSFETRALSTGTFPVTVVVQDATGTRELERTTLRVRATAFSGPAVAATGALVLILLVVGALRRRPREPRLKVVTRRDPTR